MILKLHHPTDPRFLVYPIAPPEISDAGLFEDGKLLVCAPGEPDAIYDHNHDSGTWVKRKGAEPEAALAKGPK